MPNSTAETADLSTILGLGNNLIEIAALTTLFGSNIAETLVLGERGSAGLVWGITSAFGAPSVIKACISGASSGWLRSLLGLRTISSDQAVGLDLILSPKSNRETKVRASFDNNPLGVACDAEALQKTRHRPLSRDHPSCRDIYAFNRPTMQIFERLPKTFRGDPLTVYEAAPHPFFRVHTVIIQSSALALSLLKWLELYYYWSNGARHLALISGIPFAFFFVFGCITAFRDMFLARRANDIGNLDVILGELPTWKKSGGEKKVVLGLHADPRISIWWRLMWSIGGLLHASSLILTYYILSKMTSAFTLAWAGFQLAWLACRILTFYFTDSIDPMADRMVIGRQLQDLDVSMKTRVLNLTLAAAQYQVYVHSRSIDSYGDDSFSPQYIMSLLGEPRKLQMSCQLPHHFDPSKSSSVEVEIVAVIGDAALLTALWMVGSDVPSADMYDSCLVFLSFPQPPLSSSLGPQPAPSRFAIPAARVVSRAGREFDRLDSENSIPIFVPRGTGPNFGYIETWWYWIPCGPNRWLQIRSKNLTVLGRCTAEVLDDEQLSAVLAAGTLNISLTHVNEVRDVVKLSSVGVESLFNLLPGTE